MKKIFSCIVLFVAFTSGCSLGGSVTLKGDVQNNIVSAVSVTSGKIVQMKVAQGQPVKKGDLIAMVDNTNQKYAVEQLSAVVDMKKAKLAELTAGARKEQIQQAEAALSAAKAQLDLLTAGNRAEQIEQGKIGVKSAEEAVFAAEVTYDYNKTQYDHATALFESGVLSQKDLDAARLQKDLAESQLNGAKLQLLSAKEQLGLLQNGSTAQAIDAARANFDSAKAALELLKSGPTAEAIAAAQADVEQSAAQLNQAQNALENCNITALSDGIVISKHYELGDVVNIGSNIADIAVEKDLYVLCYIPDKFLDKIYYNQPLTVKTPAGEQTGRVSYIALQHEYTPKDKQSTTDAKHVATKIKVAIEGDGKILKSGIGAEVLVPLQ